MQQSNQPSSTIPASSVVANLLSKRPLDARNSPRPIKMIRRDGFPKKLIRSTPVVRSRKRSVPCASQETHGTSVNETLLDSLRHLQVSARKRRKVDATEMSSSESKQDEATLTPAGFTLSTSSPEAVSQRLKMRNTIQKAGVLNTIAKLCNPRIRRILEENAQLRDVVSRVQNLDKKGTGLYHLESRTRRELIKQGLIEDGERSPDILTMITEDDE